MAMDHVIDVLFAADSRESDCACTTHQVLLPNRDGASRTQVPFAMLSTATLHLCWPGMSHVDMVPRQDPVLNEFSRILVSVLGELPAKIVNFQLLLLVVFPSLQN